MKDALPKAVVHSQDVFGASFLRSTAVQLTTRVCDCVDRPVRSFVQEPRKESSVSCDELNGP